MKNYLDDFNYFKQAKDPRERVRSAGQRESPIEQISAHKEDEGRSEFEELKLKNITLEKKYTKKTKHVKELILLVT